MVGEAHGDTHRPEQKTKLDAKIGHFTGTAYGAKYAEIIVFPESGEAINLLSMNDEDDEDRDSFFDLDFVLTLGKKHHDVYTKFNVVEFLVFKNFDTEHLYSTSDEICDKITFSNFQIQHNLLTAQNEADEKNAEARRLAIFNEIASQIAEEQKALGL